MLLVFLVVLGVNFVIFLFNFFHQEVGLIGSMKIQLKKFKFGMVVNWPK